MKFQCFHILTDSFLFSFFLFIIFIQVAVKWYVLVVLIFIFLITNDVKNHLLIGHLYIFCFGELSVQVLRPFFNWVVFLLSYGSSLYILDIKCFAFKNLIIMCLDVDFSLEFILLGAFVKIPGCTVLCLPKLKKFLAIISLCFLFFSFYLFSLWDSP